MHINVVITGATGMVGEGVLHECLMHADVKSVLVISRRPCGISHVKLEEIILADIQDLSSVENRLINIHACYFCMGVSSIGMKESEYHQLTYNLTMRVAKTLLSLNPGMIFCYISGAGTDSTEKGRSMWARVKGKTENHLMQLPFKKAYMFRPGFISPTKGLKNTLKFYKYVLWLIPLMHTFFPKYICTLREIGLAMINATTKGYHKSILEVEDIVALSK